LAESLTSLFFDDSIAKSEREEFSKVFSKGKVPEEMPTFSLCSLNLEKVSLLNVLASTEKFGSKGEIRRLVKQGAIKLDNVRVDDPEMALDFEPEKNDLVIKAGKKIFIRIER
jgi:tyrosyl-tRNA synthetase